MTNDCKMKNEEICSFLEVFLLGATSKNENWGARQIIAAETQEQAISISKFDYSDTAKWCDKMEGVQATGKPRILFTHWGG